eukprot:TRINITY_DN7522_c0_g1_i1.p1 TRINITY_DN7522_c0_g1~~TRINITY_DN7522_c0_g1_i1.p1  ORF type:complete len:561 (-),score=197.03 TRINITY_DN7522_c0_g1_i1:55-1737(-)
MEEQPQHRQAVKKGIDMENMHRKREEFSVSIRKNKREESLAKRRNIGAVLQQIKKDESSAAAQIDDDEEEEEGPIFSDLNEMARAAMGTEKKLYLPAVTQIRKLLSMEQNPPIEAVVATGVLPRLVELLNAVDTPKLQFEAAWAVTNVASGSSQHTTLLIQLGAVPTLISLLAIGDAQLREQAVWALGNIAGDGTHYRDTVIRLGIMQPLLRILTVDVNKGSLIRNATWTLSNMCRGKPPPDFLYVKPAIPVLGSLLSYRDPDVVADAIWALSYITDGLEDRIQACVEAGICKLLVPVLKINNINLQIPALRTLGNIVTGSHSQTQAAVDAELLPSLLPLIRSGKKCLRKEACWAASNVAAGTKDQISAVIRADLIPVIVEVLNCPDMDLRKEAGWAICNACSGGSPEHVRYIVSQGVLPPLVDILRCNDAKMVLVVLEALENVLKVGDMLAQTGGANPFAELVREAQGVDMLQKLQDHENESIYTKAVRILEDFYDAKNEDDDDDEEVDEDDAEEDQAVDAAQQPIAFSFGAPQATPFPTGAAAAASGTAQPFAFPTNM